jgi:nucleoside phosphorylase
MKRAQATTEPAEQASRVLLQYIADERDPRQRELMIRDCLARASQLPADAREAVEAQILGTLQPSLGSRREDRPLQSVPTGTRKAVDVLVVTVIPIELTAAKIAFSLDRHAATHEGRRYFESTVDSAQAGRELSVVVTDIGEARNVNAAVALSEMQKHYAPGAYFLVGIAAGRRGEVKLGDVVRPIEICDFEGGTARKTGDTPRPQHLPMSASMRQNLGYHDPTLTSFYPQLDKAIQKLPREHWPPEVDLPFRPGFPDKVFLASGEKVLRDDSLKSLAERFDERIKAADMESVGFASQLGAVPWAVFRGITDFGDPKKADGWHGFAALAACVVLRDFLEAEYEPPDVGKL